MNKRSSSVPDARSLPSVDWDAIEEGTATLLSRYIQFDTTNPPGHEAAAIEFLADLVRERGFAPKVVESGPGRANLITRLPGRNGADAPPCLLYAHADVVPTNPGEWSYPPFGGQLQDGFVWGRGALDDKGLGVIFVQTLSLLKDMAPPLDRDLILLIAADEEIGGRHGVAWLLDNHPDLIKAGYVWDEGGAGLSGPIRPEQNLYAIAVAEKGTLTVKLIAWGKSGHASTPRSDNPLELMVRVLARLKNWRRPPRLTETVREMLHLLSSSQPFPGSLLFAQAGNRLLWPFLRFWLEQEPFFLPLIGNTVSLTMLHSGQKSNVIPDQAEAILDIRLLPGEDPAAVIADLRSFIGDLPVTVETEDTPVPHLSSSTTTDFYRALTETLRYFDPDGLVMPYLTPGTTDSRFFRRAGMQSYGFLPFLLDAGELSRIHGIDERISTANLRWGVEVAVDTLRRL